ncbi:MAG TPA: CBS domain-containing protein [Kofleriaceae bacterium]|nr:CBS domain-containing protein [Kofleriaceae bacterium]
MKRYEIRVADLMTTALVTIKSSEPVSGAHAEMQVGVIRHLPVIDDRGRLVGVLSDRDVIKALTTRKPQRVSDIMTRDVVTTTPQTMAHEAAAIMLDLKISSLPVIDEGGALVGLITQTDYLELARRALLGLPLER